MLVYNKLTQTNKNCVQLLTFTHAHIYHLQLIIIIIMIIMIIIKKVSICYQYPAVIYFYIFI